MSKARNALNMANANHAIVIVNSHVVQPVSPVRKVVKVNAVNAVSRVSLVKMVSLVKLVHLVIQVQRDRKVNAVILVFLARKVPPDTPPSLVNRLTVDHLVSLVTVENVVNLEKKA